MSIYIRSLRGLSTAVTLVAALSACTSRVTRPEAQASAPVAATSTEKVKSTPAPIAAPPARPARPQERKPRRVMRDGVMANNDIMTITTLPVGAGNCQILQCPSQDKIIVFDCGSLGAGTQNWDVQQVTQYIDNLVGDDTEVVVAVSHTDGDHNNYLPTVFANIYVHDVVIAQQRGAYPLAVRNWFAEVEADDGTVWSWPGHYVGQAPDDELSCWVEDGQGGWDMDVEAYVLAVNAAGGANSASLVVSETYDNFQTIFTGDMTQATEDLINSDLQINLGDTDVITGAHHGADTYGSNSQTWVDANQATMVIFSAGTRHYHPRCTSVDRYLPHLGDDSDDHGYHCGNGGGYVHRNTDDNIVVTDDNGLIKVTTDGDDYNFTWTVNGAGAGDARNDRERRVIQRSAKD